MNFHEKFVVELAREEIRFIKNYTLTAKDPKQRFGIRWTLWCRLSKALLSGGLLGTTLWELLYGGLLSGRLLSGRRLGDYSLGPPILDLATHSLKTL